MNVFPRAFQNQCSLHRQRADNPIYKRHIAQPILCFKNEKPETWQTQTTLPRANIVLEKSNQCKVCPTMWWYIVGGDNNPISPEISHGCQRVEWDQTTKRLWRRHQIGNWTLQMLGSIKWVSIDQIWWWGSFLWSVHKVHIWCLVHSREGGPDSNSNSGPPLLQCTLNTL